MKNLKFLLVLIMASFLLTSCKNMNKVEASVQKASFKLQLLHFADIDGNEEIAIKALPNFSALINHFKKDAKLGSATLVLSSGDNIIPGPRFYAAEHKNISKITGSNEPGHLDIAFMNSFGTVASALGNHELDASFKEFLDALKPKSKSGANFSGAQFPYLSANIDFSTDEVTAKYIGKNGAFAKDLKGKLVAYTKTKVNNEIIGIVGATTPLLATITDTGTTKIYPQNYRGDIKSLAAKIQPSIDALMAEGINKIILLAHMQQIHIEKSLAPLLKGVDIIVAGGSNTRMGDSTDSLYPGDSHFAEDYPYVTKGADAAPVLIVNVDGDYKYLGRLVVDFNIDGEIIVDSLDKNLNGAWASTNANLSSLNAKPLAEAVRLHKALSEVINSQFGNLLGFTKVYLDGRRFKVRTEETNLGNLSADANLWYANKMAKEQVDISFKNGGGIRTDIGAAIVPPGATSAVATIYSPPKAKTQLKIPEGAITEGHLKAVLRFDNGLVTLSLSAAELKMILEHSVASSGLGKTPGAFAQIAGMSFSFDLNRQAGDRVRDINILDSKGKVKDRVAKNGKILGDAERSFRMVTLNFLANGGDAYPFAQLKNPQRRNLYKGRGYGEKKDFPAEYLNKDPNKNSSFSYTGGEQDALAEYLLANFATIKRAYNKVETPIAKDKRIRQLAH